MKSVTIRGARLKWFEQVQRRGVLTVIARIAVPFRPLADHEVFIWDGEERPVYLRDLKPETYA